MSRPRARARERTFADYVDRLDRYIRPALDGYKLANLRPLDIQKAYADLQARGLSPRTIRYAHSILASALRQAVLWNMLPRNPCDVVELPRQVRREMRALAPDEAARFLEAARADRFGVLFAFALTTGMRPEEYLGLQWKDVDLERGAATVCRTVVWRAGGGWYFGEPKTARSRRTIPLPPSLVRQLVAHRRQQAEARLKAGAAYAVNLYETEGRRQHCAGGRHTGARVLLAERKYAEANRVLAGAVETFERGGPSAMLADSLTLQGVVWARLGSYESSVNILRHAADVAERIGAHQSAGRAVVTLIEEHGGRHALTPADLYEAYSRADGLLKATQDAEDLTRLRACARAVMRRLAGMRIKERNFTLHGAVHELEARLVGEALAEAKGSVTKAARLLGIPYQTLSTMLKTRHKPLLRKRTPAKERKRSIMQRPDK